MIESAEEFVALRESDNPDEYRRAAHDSAPDAVWLDAIERYPTMRFWVAQNKTVPMHVLRILAGDPDPKVRSMVASKRKLDASLLELLASDVDSGVRGAVAYNPKTPPAVLELLLHDSWKFIVDKAKARLARDIRS